MARKFKESSKFLGKLTDKSKANCNANVTFSKGFPKQYKNVKNYLGILPTSVTLFLRLTLKEV